VANRTNFQVIDVSSLEFSPGYGKDFYIAFEPGGDICSIGPNGLVVGDDSSGPDGRSEVRGGSCNNSWSSVGAPADHLIRAVVSTFLPVTIDIKPGSDPNSINLCSDGAVPVAIMGSAKFDVNNINTDTLRLADAAVKVVGKKDPHTLCSTEDVNADGYDDLVCHFNTTELATILDGTSTSATLKGQTVSGTPIQGSANVTIVKDGCE
jgi:hypothetical protein